MPNKDYKYFIFGYFNIIILKRFAVFVTIWLKGPLLSRWCFNYVVVLIIVVLIVVHLVFQKD